MEIGAPAAARLVGPDNRALWRWVFVCRYVGVAVLLIAAIALPELRAKPILALVLLGVAFPYSVASSRAYARDGRPARWMPWLDPVVPVLGGLLAPPFFVVGALLCLAPLALALLYAGRRTAVAAGASAFVSLTVVAVVVKPPHAGVVLLGVGVSMFWILSATGLLAGAERRARDELVHLANHDPLTGLANRRAYEDALHRALAEAERRHAPVALLVIDLDGFKAVNDTHGHDAGDSLPRALASRLLERVRRSDLLARTGGDEFVVLCTTNVTPRGMHLLARDLGYLAAKPVAIGAKEVTVSASIGIAFHPDHGDDARSLQRAADLAMYEAKRTGASALVAARRAPAHR
ncbi:MAG: GGDEF domain-containing protein [Actinobacteria bacterium]|nr:GGDEF domain-containing protein [Actinomycetota bacterium]